MIERAEVPDPFASGVTGFDAKLQSALLGQFGTDKVTALLYPADEATVIVELAALPCVTLTWDGLAETEKSGDAAVPHPVNLNEPTRVLQLNAPSAFRYSLIYQKVQSSDGSMRKEL